MTVDAVEATTKPEQASIGELVKDVSTHFSTVLHGEIELAKIELKSSVKKVGFGAIGFVLVAVVALYALTFLFIALAEYIHWQWHFYRWASFLTVFGFLIVVICIPVTFLSIRSIKKVRPPERTIATTKSTVEALRHPGAAAERAAATTSSGGAATTSSGGAATTSSGGAA